MESQDILATIAQVAATCIGFTGVIFAIGKSAQGGWTDAERNAVFNLPLPSMPFLSTSREPRRSISPARRFRNC